MKKDIKHLSISHAYVLQAYTHVSMPWVLQPPFQLPGLHPYCC